MTYIKLTREDGTTRNGMRWDVGVTNRATGKGNKLCTDGVLHVYDTPEQAAFMRPAHCHDYNRAWEVRSQRKGVTDGTKRGIKSCTVVREIELPEITTEQLVEIAVRVSLLVYNRAAYVEWAGRWLSGEDRSATAAYVAADSAADAAAYVAYAAPDSAVEAAYTAADAAAYAAPDAAAEAAYTAAYAAAYAAAEAAYAAADSTADSAYTAAEAAHTAAYATAYAAAYAAADAADSAVYEAAGYIDLQSIIEEVLK